MRCKAKNNSIILTIKFHTDFGQDRQGTGWDRKVAHPYEVDCPTIGSNQLGLLNVRKGDIFYHGAILMGSNRTHSSLMPYTDLRFTKEWLCKVSL